MLSIGVVLQSNTFAAEPSVIISTNKPSYKIGESATFTVTGGQPNTVIYWTSWKHDPATNTLVLTNEVFVPGGITDHYGNWTGTLSPWTGFDIGVRKRQAVIGNRTGFITFAVTPKLTVNAPVIVSPAPVSFSLSGAPPNSQIIWETWFNGALVNSGQYFGFNTDANGNWPLPGSPPPQPLQPSMGNGLYKLVAVIGNHRASVEYTAAFKFTVDKAVYNVDDKILFSLSGAPANSQIIWNTWHNGQQVQTNAFYGHYTNPDGAWSALSDRYLPQYAGIWRQRLTVGGQQFEVAYNVIPAPPYNAYTKKLGSYIWLGTNRESDLKLYEKIYGRFLKLTFFDGICQGGQPTTLISRAQNAPDLNKVFSNPNIHTYHVVAQDAAITSCGAQPLFISNPSALTPQKLSEISNEYKQFTLYLYQQHTGTGKRFILGTWEADNILYCGEPASYVTNRPVETVWVEDAVPAGATIAADNESWNFVSSNPAPFSGTAAHQSSLYGDVHQHYFFGATDKLVVNSTSTLYAYVYLDPINPPRQIMLQWNNGDWEHRAYWGENLIGWGTDGTDSRRNMGPLPAPGQWVRLEIPATSVFDFPPTGQGGANTLVNGMAFTLYDGQATWDKAGVITPFRESCNTAFGEPNGYPGVTGPLGVAQNVGKWFAAAQKGVFEGRKQAAKNGWYGAEVYYAPEIVSENLLQNAPSPGPYASLLDNVLPTLNPGLDSDGEQVPRYDFVSYSSYDSINLMINNPSSTALVNGLSRISSVTGTSNVFIGEFSYSTSIPGFDNPAVQEAHVDKVLNDALFNWRSDSLVPGVPLVNWWEIRWPTFGMYNPSGDQLLPIGIYFNNKLKPLDTTAIVTCDNSYDLYFNGSYKGSGTNWTLSQTYPLTPQTGKNVIAIAGVDAGGIAGLLAEIQVAGQRLGSNMTWKVSLTPPPNWTDVNLDDSGWANATDYGPYGVGPWGTGVSGMPNDTPAKWIWSSNNDAHNVVYFRFSFTK
jgi:hypothetical protein